MAAALQCGMLIRYWDWYYPGHFDYLPGFPILLLLYPTHPNPFQFSPYPGEIMGEPSS